MNSNTKLLFAAVLVIIMGVFAYAAISYVNAYSNSIDPTSLRNFSVTAQGESIAIPDVAEFSFTVLTQGGPDLTSLQGQNTERMNAVISFLKEQQIEDEDIKTQQYRVEPRYQYFNCRDGGVCPPAEIVGYNVVQSVSVKVRDFESAGEILAGVVENGANSVSQISFTVDDPTEVENEARARAIQKAKEKAQSIAEAGGFGLGRLISIQEGSSFTPSPRFGLDSAQEGTGAATPPTIEPGSQTTTISITATYEIR